MWIDGPVLPRRGYVNMIKADYSVHLQIKGAEPISTPTFNTGRTTGRAKMDAFYSPILRKKFQGTLSNSYNLCFSFHWFVLSKNEKGYQNNPEKLPVIIV